MYHRGLLVLALLAVVKADFRIVNGTDAEEGEFPFAVSLRNNFRHTCGATVLNANYVLTAAHCICTGPGQGGDPRVYSIQYGSRRISATGERSIQVSRIICHQFNSNQLTFDAAVLQLESPIPEGSYQPVQLARSYDGSVSQNGVIIGWGRNGTNEPVMEILQKAEVEVYTDEICEQRFDLNHHICFGAPYIGACNGDSGTALLVNGYQVGIASFITSTCGISSPQTPNVYSRVPEYYQWIAQQAGL